MAHQSTLDAFVSFSEPLEGNVPSLYVDVKQLLTVGIGCLVDPLSLALSLPWVNPDGSPTSASDVALQWGIVKASAPRLCKLHWKFAAPLTKMRLTPAGVLQVAERRLLGNEKILRSYFPNWDAIPADGQLGIFSMAWACGAGFPRTFGNFREAVNRQDWTGAIAACGIRTEGNPGIIPRNAQNRLCFANAHQVITRGLPINELHWPATVPAASQRDAALHVEATQLTADHREAIVAACSATDRAFQLGAYAYPVDSDSGHSGRDVAGSDDPDPSPANS